MFLSDYIANNCTTVERAGADCDVVFFGVNKHPEANANSFIEAIKSHPGVFNKCNPLDGYEHNYLELGAWVGDQAAALMLIGLGKILGVWDILTPRIVLGDDISNEMESMLVGHGLVTIAPKRGKDDY